MEHTRYGGWPTEGPRRWRGAACVPAALALLAACGGSETTPDDPAVVRTDSAGVEIVETNTPTWEDGDAWSVDPEPELVIGRLEGEEPYLFGEVRGAVRLDDGSVVVVDNQPREVRWFDLSGTFVRAVGGPGDGPREFSQSAWKLQRCGPDRLYVHDLWGQRISVWDTGGELVRGFDLVEPVDPTRGPYNHTCRPDGGFVATGWGDFSALPELPPGEEAMLYSQYAPVWTLDSIGALETDFGSFLSSERIRTGGGSGPHPFGRAVKFTATGGRIFIGTGEGLAVDVYRGGERVAIWRAAAPNLTVDDALVERYRSAELTEDAERERDRFMDADNAMPPEMPGYTELHATPDGHLWAKRFAPPWEATNRWGIFAPDGVFLGNLELPEDMWVTEIGNEHVVGVVTDELDVERVHVYRIRRP